jgi:hypothetical protein
MEQRRQSSTLPRSTSTQATRRLSGQIDADSWWVASRILVGEGGRLAADGLFAEHSRGQERRSRLQSRIIHSSRPSHLPAKLGSMKRLKVIDNVRSLGLQIPFEEPQADTIRQKIGNREAVLLNRLNLFSQVEVLGR